MPITTQTAGSFPSTLQGTITLTVNAATAWTVGNWVYVGTWATATFRGRVVRSSTTSNKIIVKRISGSLSSAAALKERVAGGGSDGAATGTVATITQAVISGVAVNYGGWNLRETDAGITRSKVVRLSPLRVQVEVMWAQRQLNTIRTDFATPVTFTLTGGAWSAPSIYDVSNGDVITLTIVSSEPVIVPAGATYAITVGATSRTATLLASSANLLSHTFSYSVVTGDQGSTTVAVTAGTFGGSGTFFEVAVDGSQRAITSPAAVGGSLATKSGLTIQA